MIIHCIDLNVKSDKYGIVLRSIDNTGSQKKESYASLTRVGDSVAFWVTEHEYDVKNALSRQNFIKI